MGQLEVQRSFRRNSALVQERQCRVECSIESAKICCQFAATIGRIVPKQAGKTGGVTQENQALTTLTQYAQGFADLSLGPLGYRAESLSIANLLELSGLPRATSPPPISTFSPRPWESWLRAEIALILLVASG